MLIMFGSCFEGSILEIFFIFIFWMGGWEEKLDGIQGKDVEQVGNQ